MDLAVDIVEEVAERERTAPLDLPPLYDSIDIDSIEKCIGSAGDYATVHFGYCDYDITIKENGSVLIDSDEPPTGKS